MTCPHCLSSQQSFICPECHYFNPYILAYKQYITQNIQLPAEQSKLPETGKPPVVSKLLSSLLLKNPQFTVFQTYADVNYSEFDSSQNFKFFLDKPFDTIILANPTFKLPLQFFNSIPCRCLYVDSYQCVDQPYVANVLTNSNSLEFIILGFSGQSQACMLTNYQLFIQSCSQNQKPSELPPEYLIYYENCSQPKPLPKILSTLTLQSVLQFKNTDLSTQRMFFTCLTPIASSLFQLKELQLNICKQVSVSGLINMKVCVLLDFPNAVWYLQHLVAFVKGLPNLARLQLFDQNLYQLLPIFNYEIYDSFVELHFCQLRQQFELEPQMDLLMSKNPISSNIDVFDQLFEQRQVKTASKDYCQILTGYNYDYYTMSNVPLQLVEYKQLLEQSAGNEGIFRQIIPPRASLSLLRQLGRNVWFQIDIEQKQGCKQAICDYFTEFQLPEMYGEKLIKYLQSHNLIFKQITHIILFDYHRIAKLGLNQNILHKKMKVEVFYATFYPNHQDFTQVVFQGSDSLLLQGFPEFCSNYYKSEMQAVIDFLLNCVKVSVFAGDCPTVNYFRNLLNEKLQHQICCSEDIFLPVMCQFYYLYENFKPKSLQIYVEYKIHFKTDSFMNYNNSSQTIEVVSKQFAQNEKLDINNRIKLYFDMFPSVETLIIENATNLLVREELADLFGFLQLQGRKLEVYSSEIESLLVNVQNASIVIQSKYLKHELFFYVRLLELLRQHSSELSGSKILRLLEADSLVIQRISDNHLFNDKLSKQQRQTLYEFLQTVIQANQVRILDFPKLQLQIKSAKHRESFLFFTDFLLQNRVQVVRSSFLNYPKCAFLTSFLQSCRGGRKIIQNIGFLDYRATFQLLLGSVPRLQAVEVIAFQQFQQNDQLLDFAPQIVELCTGLAGLKRVLFIENGLSPDKQAQFEQLLLQLGALKFTVIEPNFDLKALQQRFKGQVEISGDLIVRNGIVLQHYDQLEDVFDILEIDERIRLINELEPATE